MPIPRWAIAVLVCLPVLAIHGQQRQVTGPVAGYVFDGAALRPIAGVPGGATLGGALDLGLAASAVAVSPKLDSAIVTASDGSLHLFRLSGNTATEVWWNGLPTVPARVVYSPSGMAAAIYAAGRVQAFIGLPNAPVPAFSAELGPPATGTERQSASAALQAIAVSDDAAWLLAAINGRVSLLSVSGSSSVILEGAREAAVAFAPGSHAAAVLNGSAGSLHRFFDVSEAPSQMQRLPAPGLAEPAGLAFTADGKFVLAATRTGKSVRIFDFAGGAATTLDCACAPTGVARMGSLFRLTDAGSGPVWMVDTGASPPRIVFVPARANP